MFWYPTSVLYDPGFANDIFTDKLRNCNICSHPIPPRRHNKKVLESKNRVLRDIYLRLCDDPPVSTEDDGMNSFLIQMAIRISNVLYGNDTLSSNELAKGYTRPIQSSQFPSPILQDLVTAREVLKGKRELTLIVRSNSTEKFMFSRAILFKSTSSSKMTNVVPGRLRNQYCHLTPPLKQLQSLVQKGKLFVQLLKTFATQLLTMILLSQSKKQSINCRSTSKML